MDLRRLRSFVAVAEEGHLGRAAQRLHLTQPPLTRQIHQLEEELGGALFTRTPKGMELTDAGRVLLVDARHILELTERASERAQRAGQGTYGRIDVAVFGTAIFGVIPLLLRPFSASHPEVTVVLHNLDKAEQLEALQQRRISLAFNRILQPEPPIVSEVLLTEPLFIAVPSNHQLAARTAVRIAELQHETLVLYPTGLRPSFIDRVLELCAAAGFTPATTEAVADVVHGIALVATGIGLSFVPWSATNLHVPGVSYRPIAQTPRPNVELCCVYRDCDGSPVLRNLLASIRATAPTLVATMANGRSH